MRLGRSEPRTETCGNQRPFIASYTTSNMTSVLQRAWVCVRIDLKYDDEKLSVLARGVEAMVSAPVKLGNVEEG